MALPMHLPHRDHTVPGARADCKAAYDKYARSLGGGMRVISVFAGSFIQNLDFGVSILGLHRGLIIDTPLGDAWLRLRGRII